MRRGVLAAIVLGAFAVSCTAFVASQLSNYQGPGPTTGGCFLLPSNACGSCISQRCEDPTGSPPVSLQSVCGFSSSDLPYQVRSCATDPSVGSNYYGDNCSSVFVDGGAYASSIDTQGSAENNVKKCITDNCFGQCRICTTTVSPCSGDQIDLQEAGACGACLYNAMNQLNGSCELGAIQNCGYIQDDLAKCAVPSGSCTSPDCSTLQSPPTSADPSLQSLLSCLWASCQSSCQ